jgi:glycosyltransferase involved in cell wall biosynthesis
METTADSNAPAQDAPISPRAVSHMARSTSLRRLSVLMPVYNERPLLETVVRRVLDAANLIKPLELEIVAVDDGSTDGSWDVLQRVAAVDGRLRAFRLTKNRGKGAAVRVAIERMSGDVAVIQDADLEYDPREFSRLLEPILTGRADAVFGSRFAAAAPRSRLHWHACVNRLLTLFSNRVTGLALSDMETCYKMVRTNVLRKLRLVSRSFTIEPEITCRLAQLGVRIEEIPISYQRRTWREGKKIGPIDGVKAVWAIARFGMFQRGNGRAVDSPPAQFAEKASLR